MEMIPFTYQDSPVRTVLVDGEPWFVAKDVCDHSSCGESDCRATQALGSGGVGFDAAAGVHAVLECAEQARHIAQALVLLNEPTSSVDYRARLALLAQTVNYPPAGVDPAGNLAQTMQENDEERARRREEEASDGENV